MHPLPRIATVFALAVLVPTQSHAAAQDIALTFGSLPSAQGFTYTPSGAHSGAVESSVFSVSGGVLVQNSLSQYVGSTGASIFYSLPSIITAAEPKVLQVRARCLGTVGSSVATVGQGGFVFGFATGAQQYAFGLTGTRMTVLTSGGTLVLPDVVDNSQFHDYRLEYSAPSTTRLYRDNVLVHTNTSGFALAANRLFLGDGTGGANAHGEVAEFHFTQGAATAAPTTTWGRVKSMFHD